MASNIDSIEIFPSENGGHRVLHNFKREAPGKKGGAMLDRLRAPISGSILDACPTCRDSWHPWREF